MLAGLLFAVHDADDRPERLTATLPFGGVTLIEYQARLLIAAGVSQVIVVVARLTPELLGALSRIGRRGVTVDAVRHASEAVDKLHPLARVLMLADGLITTEGVVTALADEGGDALLVLPQADAGHSFERVGGNMAWAGVARLDPRRVAEVARLPRDYDIQSTLLRVTEQARPVHVLLPPSAVRHGHGIEHQAAALDARGRAVLASIVSDRRGWFDRWLVAPIARLALPVLVDRQVPAATIGIAGALTGIIGLVLVAIGWSATGLAAALVGCLVLALGATLSSLRDEPRIETAQRVGTAALPGVALLFLGAGTSARAGDHGAMAIAVALVVLGGLAERAGPERVRRLWWGMPGAYLLIVTASTILGLPTVGLALTAAYAAATAAAAIERLRRQA